MSTILFWSHWNKVEKGVFFGLLFFALSAFIVFGYAYFQNPSLVYTFDQFQELKFIDVALRSFLVGVTSVEIPIENLLIFETYLGSDLQPATWVYYLFLAALVVGLLFFIAFITTLKRYSFLGGIGFVILILVNFHWETLLIFGLSNKIFTIVVTLVFASTAYYFQSFRTEVSFIARLIFFSAIALILFATVLVGSRTEHPFQHLAINGLTTGIVMSIVFIAMVAHEPIALFVSVVTNAKRPTRTAGHFYLITAIYLANLLITYLIKERYLFWNIYTVNSLFLLTTSAIIGIWGTNKRAPLYADSVSYIPSVIYLYLGFLITTFGTLTFCFATHSTTMMEGFDDIILFMHLAYGIIFTTYVTANFGPMLLANISVHKILYRPAVMPFFTFRTMSLIATFAFLSFSSPLNTYFDRAKATYYNAYGDMYLSMADPQTAEVFYKKSIATRNRNHHAHYALANLYASQLNPPAALAEYEKIIRTTPSEIAYLNYSDIHQTNGQYEKAAALLQEGIRLFPSSGVLLNAQALNYFHLNRLDSSSRFFHRARKDPFTKDAAATNLFATSAQLRLPFPADSLLELIGSKDVAVQGNAFALATIQRHVLPIQPILSNDTVLTARSAAAISNQLSNQRETVDTIALRNYVALAKKPVNTSFKEYVLQAAAYSYYERGMINNAFELMRELAFATGAGKYFFLHGNWLLEQNNAATAALYFRTAEDKNYDGASFMQALAWTQADSTRKALPLWDALIQSADSSNRMESLFYKKVIQATKQDALRESDMFKYQYCRTRVSLSDSLWFDQLTNSMKEEYWKTRAILHQSKKWFALDEPNKAIESLSKLNGLTLTNKILADEINAFNLMLAAATSNWPYLEKKMKDLPSSRYANEKILLSAMLAMGNGQADIANQNFTYLQKANFQFEEAVVATARFLENNNPDKMQSYGLLVNGLLAKPNSVKLLKEYARLAAKLGFESEALEAMDKLKIQLPPNLFKRFESTLAR